jgi:hypothetical protein
MDRDQAGAKIAEFRKRAEHKTNKPELSLTAGAVVTLDDFVAYLPKGNYIFLPTREPWPGKSINSCIPPVEHGDETIAASTWLDKYQPVHQMTWTPGLPIFIQDRLVAEGGWIERPGATILNLYRPPTLPFGDAALATPWREHVHRVYPNDADHIVHWLAHRKQRPQEKINHALLLGGAQGIGKDTLLEPVKRAVGPWNVWEISPKDLFEPFNPFVKSVILRISEAHDLGEVSRYSFYERSKSYIAAPPDVMRCNEKNLREHAVVNVCGVIITTNHKTDGIYLPADDRRHYVAWSDRTKGDFTKVYWDKLWGFYDAGGDSHVAAYLASLDLSNFNSKEPPPKTAAFSAIVDANRAPEDAELQDGLDLLGQPAAVTLLKVMNAVSAINGDFAVWLKDRKNRRAIPYRFEQCGYVPVRNPAADSGLWVVRGVRQVIYTKAELSLRDQIAAATELVEQ